VTLIVPDNPAEVAAQREEMLKLAESKFEEATGKAMRELLDKMRGGVRDTLTASNPPLPRSASQFFTLGQAQGWWEEALDKHVTEAVGELWQAGRAEATDAVLSSRSLDAAGSYIGQVRDRLSRTAQPTIPEEAFNSVRSALASEVARGSSNTQIAERIASDLNWRGPDTRFWEARRDSTKDEIARRLDAIGPKGSKAREAARLNDPEIRALQAEATDATKMLNRDRSEWETRAQRISRTETTGAYNAGAQQAYLEEGAQVKQWLATADAATRETHLDASGQCVGADEAFNVGDSELMFPGDPSGPAEEIINCRCTTIAGFSCEELSGVSGRAAEEIRGERTWRDVERGEFQDILNVEGEDADSMILNGQMVDGEFRWNQERLDRVHDPFVNGELAKATPVDEPTMTFMGGGPASGKSTILDSGQVNLPKNSVMANADEAKEILPEYRSATARRHPKAASFAHEESSILAKRLVRESLESSRNTVLDGTGNGTLQKLTGQVEQARSAGVKRVIAEYVTVDTDEAVRRAAQRGARTGRQVPESVIRGTHAAVSRVFPDAARVNLFDELRLFDTGLGGAPKLIYQKIDGVEEILDPERYAAFLRKAAG